MSKSKPPLDSPNWLLLDDVYRQGFAIPDLERGLEAERLRAKRRVGNKDTETLLNGAFWHDHELVRRRKDGLAVRSRSSKMFNPDAVFYVSAPDLAKAWPTAASPAPPPSKPPMEDTRTTRRKPGKQPKHDWRRKVAREVARALRAGKPIPPASALAQACEDEWQWQPDIRDIQKQVNQVLERLERMFD